MPSKPPNRAPLLLDANTSIPAASTLRLLGVYFHTTDPNHIHPLALDANGKPAVQFRIEKQMPKCLSPRAGVMPLLSATVMRAAVEQNMLYAAGVSKVNLSFATSMLASMCKTALGAHRSSNNLRALDYCGVPTAAATQLKLQLALIRNSLLLRPYILYELQRPAHEDDKKGYTWRSTVADNLCSFHPDAPARNKRAWAWRLLASALTSDTWQERVLDPIADKLWPAPHDAHRFAEHNSAATWRFFNNRFVLVFNVNLHCNLCHQAVVLTPRHLITTCTAPPVVALRTRLGRRPHFTARARELITTANYDALTLKAITEPERKAVVPVNLIQRLPDQLDHEYEKDVKHVTACIVRHSAEVHAKMWELVKIYVKTNARPVRPPRAQAGADQDDGDDDDDDNDNDNDNDPNDNDSNDNDNDNDNDGAPAADAVADDAPPHDDDIFYDDNDYNYDYENDLLDLIGDPLADLAPPARVPERHLGYALLPGVVNVQQQWALEARADALIADALRPRSGLGPLLRRPIALRDPLGRSDDGSDSESVPDSFDDPSPLCSNSFLVPVADLDAGYDSTTDDDVEDSDSGGESSCSTERSIRMSRLAHNLECRLLISPPRMPLNPPNSRYRRSLRIAARNCIAARYNTPAQSE
jgi:hypothetical protein